MQVNDKEAREWYEKEAAEQTWSVRTLQRNISSQYYYRMLKSQSKEPVEKEMKDLFKTRINVTILPKAVAIGELPRSEKKSTRIFDYRY